MFPIISVLVTILVFILILRLFGSWMLRIDDVIRNQELMIRELREIVDELKGDSNASINIKNFALNKLCTEHTLKNHGTLPSLEGALTHEAHPIGSAVGG